MPTDDDDDDDDNGGCYETEEEAFEAKDDRAREFCRQCCTKDKVENEE
jgi:hypothetical protein